jgi:hypothetical protein
MLYENTLSLGIIQIGLSFWKIFDHSQENLLFPSKRNVTKVPHDR